MSIQGGLSVERMCGLASVSRAGFCRSLQERQPDLEEMELRSAIQAIVIEHRLRCGYRRVTAELRYRGFPANHKRVVRLMRMDNLLALRRAAFVETTDSPRIPGAPEPRESDATQQHQPAVGSGHHLRPPAAGVCVSGNRAGRLFPQGGRLGTGSIIGRATGDQRITERIRQL